MTSKGMVLALPRMRQAKMARLTASCLEWAMRRVTGKAMKAVMM